MVRAAVGLYRAILASGSIVGVLDGVAASVFAWARGGTPAGVFRFVASGVFGQRALTGGMPMVAWGVLFHFTVAIGWTALYFRLAPEIRWLSDHRLLGGMLYGLLVWIAMNLVVLPLSNVAPRPVSLTTATVVMILIHLFVIGVPIALLQGRVRAG